MSPVTLYDASFGLFIKVLTSMAHVLDTAEKFAKENGQDPDASVSATLIDTMNPLSFQVQAISYVVKETVRRLRGTDTGAWPEDETTLAALKARVQKTLELAKSITPAELEGKDDMMVELKLGTSTRHLTAKEYVFTFAVPNAFFHLQTAYCIFRSRGVPLGKMDYLAGFSS